MSSLHGPEDPELDVLGVIHALERTCELEAKLRQAIQDTHPLSTSMDWDFSAADREREALLSIRYVSYLMQPNLGPVPRNYCYNLIVPPFSLPSPPTNQNQIPPLSPSPSSTLIVSNWSIWKTNSANTASSAPPPETETPEPSS